MDLDIKQYLMKNLIDPLKYSNTSTQEVILELASRRIQELYDTAKQFPDLIDIHKVTEYMLEDIAKSFDHQLLQDQSVSEQRGLLENIIETYRRRGSIESLENMHRYYGGDLPRDVKVVIPAYDLFRYSISQYSGTHRLKDGTYWRSGVMELIIRDAFDLNKTREFVTRELLSAGTKVLFSRETLLGGDSGLSPVLANTMNITDFDYLLSLELQMVTLRSGLQFSAGNGFTSGRLPMSGRQTLFTDRDLSIHGLAQGTRIRSESAFILDPSELIKYIPNPLVPPINILSGMPSKGKIIYVENPDSIGLASAIGAARSYDYLYPAKQYIWDIYPQRSSVHGKMSGKNSLSGTPMATEEDKSWRPRSRLPMKLDSLYDRDTPRSQIITDVYSSTSVEPVDLNEVHQELKVELYNSDGTPEGIKTDIRLDLTDVNDNPIQGAPTGNYPGYFVLGVTPLGDSIVVDEDYAGENPLTVTL